MATKQRKQLSLSEVAIEQVNDLKEHESRPSISNVVEVLVRREHQRVFGDRQPTPKQATEVAS